MRGGIETHREGEEGRGGEKGRESEAEGERGGERKKSVLKRDGEHKISKLNTVPVCCGETMINLSIELQFLSTASHWLPSRRENLCRSH